MQNRSNFLQISTLVMIIALVMLGTASARSVYAGSPAQATTEPTTAATTDTATDTTMSGTAEGTATEAATQAETAAPVATIGGDEAYPPCPARPTQATAEATNAATNAATAEGTSLAAGAAATTEATATESAATSATTEATTQATLAATVVATGGATTAASTPAATTEGASDANAATPAATAASSMKPEAFRNNNGCVLMASLSGANEVSADGKTGTGDPDGAGTAMITITRPAEGTGEICFHIETTGLTLPATGAHIHAGPAGISGKIVVPFNPPGADGKVEGCTTGVDRSLIKAILLYPEAYYVNVHTSDFAQGAIRGQLQGQ